MDTKQFLNYNKKVVGKMKNEISDTEIVEAVSVKSKVYSFITKKDKQKEEDRLNGIIEKEAEEQEEEIDKEEQKKKSKSIVESVHRKLKGIKHNIVENDISHQDYKD